MTKPRTIRKSDSGWRASLTAEQYRITRGRGMERAFAGPHWDETRPGLYACICCGTPLFRSETKYDSGTGRPSFWRPVGPDCVSEHAERSLLLRRTAVRCGACAARLGHVFKDGPRPTGLRYCLNGQALRFAPDSASTREAAE